MKAITSICIYCGSSPGRLELYSEAAKMMADVLSKRNIRLVYGGAAIGLMGTLADHMLALGGQVIGVIPKALAHKEIAHANLTELHITQSMHERKLCMAELSDGFIALPGGIGTLEELFEIWTWAQLGFHSKPCGLFNVGGYFNALLGFLQHQLQEQFIKKETYDLLMVEANAERLVDRFFHYQPPSVKKWLDGSQI
jgi:uncharacterized protein (TIGR00730 family)